MHVGGSEGSKAGPANDGGRTGADTGGARSDSGGSAPHSGGAGGAHATGSGGSPPMGSAGSVMGGAGSTASGGKGGTASAGDGGAAAGGASASGAAGGQGGKGGALTYSTNFDLVESPISEGGAWKHFGADWTLVNTSEGLAWGTQTGGAYDDSYAYLSGFPPNQMASGVVHLASPASGATHEVEILLHWSDDAHNARGYECNLAWNGGYAEIVRWNGPLNDFTYLNRSSAPSGVHEGDTLSAKIVGSTITSYLNGVQIATATDSTFKTGNPGIGLWRGGGAPVTLRDYAFTSFAATALP
jgi:hypothetical protein